MKNTETKSFDFQFYAHFPFFGGITFRHIYINLLKHTFRLVIKYD